jgi:hypothetical protein
MAGSRLSSITLRKTCRVVRNVRARFCVTGPSRLWHDTFAAMMQPCCQHLQQARSRIDDQAARQAERWCLLGGAWACVERRQAFFMLARGMPESTPHRLHGLATLGAATHYAQIVPTCRVNQPRGEWGPGAIMPRTSSSRRRSSGTSRQEQFLTCSAARPMGSACSVCHALLICIGTLRRACGSRGGRTCARRR